MDHNKTIPIQSASGHAGCPGCLPGDQSVPLCRAEIGQDCSAPLLQGPPADIQRLMQALDRTLAAALAPLLKPGHPGDRSPSSTWVKALQVEPGEVTLTLRGAAHCEAARMADAAFQALRAELPDTDIYVNHAA